MEGLKSLSASDRAFVESGLVNRYAIAFATILALVALTAAALYQVRLPGIEPKSAPAEAFSAGRAISHLQIIAAAPHPTGSAALDQVRHYITTFLSGLGLQAETQATPTVTNILARIGGTNSSKAVLLVAHMDSVVAGPGAGDNSSAVSMLLEVARAITAGTPLKNDIIFLFTDGEETGLQGAKAFVYRHPWAKDVGVVMNFDARGVGGPVLMFQTSGNNDWVISDFAKSSTRVTATSLLPDLYRLLPNDTDFTVFKGAGYDGLNFAFVNGAMYYHTRFDTLDNVDARSIQLEGDATLALSRHFGIVEIGKTGGGNDTYFDLFGSLFFYSRSWNVPLCLFVLALYCGLVALAAVKKRIQWAGMAMGFAISLMGVLAATVAALAITTLAPFRAEPGSMNFAQSDARTNFYLIGLVLSSLAAVSAVYGLFFKRGWADSIALGGSFCCLITMMLLLAYLPGGSYLFAWPLLFSLIGLAYAVFAAKPDRRPPYGRWTLMFACVVPAVLLLTPVIYLIFVGLTLKMSIAVVVLLSVSLVLLYPLLGIVSTANRWFLPVASAVASCSMIFAAVH